MAQALDGFSPTRTDPDLLVNSREWISFRVSPVCYGSCHRSACLMGQKPARPFEPDRQAPTTKCHAGQSNAQLAVHKALLVHAEIISTVIVSAKTEAARNEMREPRHPRQAPKIAGGRNIKRHNQQTDVHRKSK